jgi:hypothetical protein
MATGGRVDGSKANGGRRHAATEDGGRDATVASAWWPLRQSVTAGRGVFRKKDCLFFWRGGSFIRAVCPLFFSEGQNKNGQSKITMNPSKAYIFNANPSNSYIGY